MGIAYATTTGLVIWIVLWSLGAKSLDAFLITILVIVVASTVKLAGKYRPSSPDAPAKTGS